MSVSQPLGDETGQQNKPGETRLSLKPSLTLFPHGHKACQSSKLRQYFSLLNPASSYFLSTILTYLNISLLLLNFEGE
jgi:hypothetical protein